MANSIQVDESHIDPTNLVLTRNVRADGYWKTEKFQELKRSIWARYEDGQEPILEPITWYFMGGKAFPHSGHRRAKACQELGIKKVFGFKREPPANDGIRAIDQLTENLHREDIDPMAKARAMEKALKEDPTLTQKKLAAMIGFSTAHVSQHMKLLGLEPAIQEKVALGEMMVAAAYKIATNLTPKQIAENIEEIIVNATDGTQTKCRRNIERLASRLNEMEQLWDEIPSIPPATPPTDVPRQEPIDETAQRIRDILEMARKLIQQAIGEATEAGLDISSLLENITKEAQ